MKAFFSVPVSYLASLSVNAEPSTTTVLMGFLFAACLTKELAKHKTAPNATKYNDACEDVQMRSISEAIAKEGV